MHAEPRDPRDPATPPEPAGSPEAVTSTAEAPPARFAEAVADGILLFDGECVLCNRWVDFVLTRERSERLRFGALQSTAGRELLTWAGLPTDSFDTVVLIDRDGAHLRSGAVLRVLRALRAPWSWLRIGGILPRPLRDAMYSFVARRRFRWFGKRESCRVPTPELRARFLDGG